MDVMADQHLSEGQRQDLAADYGDKAVAYIREGVQKGFKDANQLKDSDNFKLLRERDDFKKILQDLQRNTATGA